MKNLLFDLCVFFNPTKENKCYEFVNNLKNFFETVKSSDFFTLIIIFFFLILISLIFIKKNKNNLIYLLPISLLIFYFLILINFRTNIPWVDDWEWIENLQITELSTLDWLFQPTNIHNIFVMKVFLLISNNYFNLNLEIFNFFSILLIFFISIIILKNEKINNNFYICVLILFIFSGKQFANFSQFCNFAWTICFFYIITFNYIFRNEKNLAVLTNIFLIIISPITFGLGYVIPLFVIGFIYFYEIQKRIKFIYISFSILALIISYSVPKLILADTQISSLNLEDFLIIFNYQFYVTYFGVLANLYLPWANGFAYLGVIIGFFQIIVVIYFIINNIYNYGVNSFKGFIKKNSLVIFGLIFAFIVSITRPDLPTIVSARYSVGSIIFQIGFWLLIFREESIKFLINQYFLKMLMIYIFVSGVIFPYNGIHWQATRHILNNKVLECYKKNYEKNKCNKLAYKTLFYGGNWYSYESFEKQIFILRNENKSFLNF